MVQSETGERPPGPLAETVVAFLRTQPLTDVNQQPARRFKDDTIVDVESRDLFKRHDRIYISESGEPSYPALRGMFDKLVPRPVAIVLPDSSKLPEEGTLSHLQSVLRVDFLGTLSQFLDRRLNSDIVARTLRTRQDLVDAMQHYVPQHVTDESGNRLRQESIRLVEGWEKEDESRLLVLLADAGHGKTMLTRTLAHRLASRYLQKLSGGSPSPVPVLIAFGPELAGRFTTFEGLVAQHFTRMKLPIPSLPTLRFLINHRRVLFILDGLDELLEADFGKAQDNLREFLSMAGPDAKVILTSRKAFFRTSQAVERELMQPIGIQDVRLYELQPFDDGQIDAYVSKLRKKQRIGLEHVLEHVETRELARTPHVLASLAEVAPFVDHTRTGGSTFDLLFPAIARREQENQKHTVSVELQMAFLLRLAREMLVTGESGFAGGSVAVIAAEAADLSQEWSGTVPIEELALLENHYCLTGTSDGTLVFQAQYWREYFLGRALADLAAEPGATFDVVLHRAPLPEGVMKNAASYWSHVLQERVVSLVGSGTASRNAVAILGHACALGHMDANVIRDLSPARSLSGTSFHGAMIKSLDLRGLELKGCDLASTTFVSCVLDGVDFSGSRIEGTSFLACSMKGANFSKADLISFAVEGNDAAGRIEMQTSLADQGARSPWQEGQEAVIGSARPEVRHAVDYGVTVLNNVLRKYWDPGTKVFNKVRMLVQNFSKGFTPADTEYILRRLYPALRRADYVDEQSFGGHEPAIVLVADKRDDLARFMRDGSLSDDLRGAVLDSLGLAPDDA